jgi:hypothetical protein
LVSSLSLAIVMPGLLSAEQAAGRRNDITAAQPPAGWPRLLDTFVETEEGSGSLTPPMDESELRTARYRFQVAMSADFRNHIRVWANTALMNHLTSWEAPTGKEFLAYNVGSDSVIDIDRSQQRWLVDRFTKTYLNDWSIDSLKLEWRFQHSLEDPPCPPQEMRARAIDENDLARALAGAAAVPVSDTNHVLVSTALRLLGDGSRKAAAVLYDEARRTQWENAEFHNNYGFCILPDDPVESLKALELASNLGYVRTVNICNRMLALSMTGKNAAALELADRAIDRWESLETIPSVLWDTAISNPVLLRQACPRCYILNLAIHISEESKDESEMARWHTIKSRLVPES